MKGKIQTKRSATYAEHNGLKKDDSQLNGNRRYSKRTRSSNRSWFTFKQVLIVSIRCINCEILSKYTVPRSPKALRNRLIAGVARHVSSFPLFSLGTSRVGLRTSLPGPGRPLLRPPEGHHDGELEAPRRPGGRSEGCGEAGEK